MNKKKILYLFMASCISIALITICVRLVCVPSKSIEKHTKSNHNNQITITVWIHGTKRLPGLIRLPFVKKFFDCKPGLCVSNELDPEFHHRTIADTLIATDKSRFQQNNFYLFGWSGKLSFKEREKAAQDLYSSLFTLKEKYYAMFKKYPKIRLITHSHGGNVALNLAHENINTKQLTIDELILLACPVQQKTAPFLKNTMFKQVYSLYSTLDLLQVADPQGLYDNGIQAPLFSKRLFPAQKNLKQILVTMKGRPIFHIEFMLNTFLQSLPSILDTTKDLDAQSLEYCIT